MQAYEKWWNDKAVEEAFEKHGLGQVGHSTLFFLENLKWQHQVQEKVIYSAHACVL